MTGSPHVRAEHLFLALIRDRRTVPARALASLIDIGRVEEAVLGVMNSPGYRGPGCPANGFLLPEGQELDQELIKALVELVPNGATVGFNWQGGRPWIRVTGAGDNRDVFNAALARLGRPALN